MATFSTAYTVVRENEGGYANHPNDKGGETYKGIARKIWGTWAGWRTIDELKKMPLFPKSLDNNKSLQTAVLNFYKTYFWDILHLDQVNSQMIAVELFDTSVNQGSHTAGEYLQRVLNVSNKNGTLYPDLLVDGIVGNKTLMSLNNHPNRKIILMNLNILQGYKYISICEKDKTQEVFFYGWQKRVMEQWTIGEVL